jgi:hypothetical protein
MEPAKKQAKYLKGTTAASLYASLRVASGKTHINFSFI